MRWQKELIVIKVGGEILSSHDALSSLCQGIAQLKHAGAAVIVVHGGGNQISAWAKKLGYVSKFINGRRITDAQNLDLAKMLCAGKINIEILSQLHVFAVAAVGLSGVDGHILHVHRRPPQPSINLQTQQQQMLDYGFVADIEQVNSALITSLIEKNFTPVIAPLACDHAGVIYNINADTVAAAIAVSLQATEWLIVSNVDGIYDANGNVLAHITAQQAQQFMQQGTINGGMVPKIQSILTSLHAGIRKVQIINGFNPQAFLQYIDGTTHGTMVTL